MRNQMLCFRMETSNRQPPNNHVRQNFSIRQLYFSGAVLVVLFSNYMIV
jgi:hypothetical protein